MSDNYTADWVRSPGRQGIQGSISEDATRPRHQRGNNPETGYNLTSAISASSKKGMLPFDIIVYEAGRSAPNDLVEKYRLSLLINPNDTNLGSTQVLNTQFARDGHVNSLWGAEQSTFTGNGSSAAFLTSSGLADTSFFRQKITKKDSLAYANVMSFVALIRNNGYRHLGVGIQAPEGGLGTSTSSQSETHSVTEEILPAPDNYSPYLPEIAYSPLVKGMLGDNRSRVIHVMDTLAISYGGTVYLGSFNSFTLEDDAQNPFKFGYSFEFVISGILGDNQEGHLSSGNNANSGIRAYVQGIDGNSVNSVSSQYDLNLEDVNKYLKQVRSAALDRFVSAEFLNDYVNEGLVRLSTTSRVPIDITDISAEMRPAVDEVIRAYTKYAAQSDQDSASKSVWYPPVITSGRDGKHATNSLHYKGLALDLRTNGMDSVTKLSIFGELSRTLPGKGYFVLLHPKGENKEHLHIEKNPQRAGALVGD